MVANWLVSTKTTRKGNANKDVSGEHLWIQLPRAPTAPLAENCRSQAAADPWRDREIQLFLTRVWGSGSSVLTSSFVKALQRGVFTSAAFCTNQLFLSG